MIQITVNGKPVAADANDILRVPQTADINIPTLRGIDALGFVFDGSGKVLVGSVGPNLKERGCKFCTACVAVCPTGAIMDKGIRRAAREDELLPCVAACPAGINIPIFWLAFSLRAAILLYCSVRTFCSRLGEDHA
ncbi:MAG: 4Fe-4S binding protein [Deltaproteobacteria bacterium]|nr:4Fe-4S binding protein [Deltaproteobacteria bacterium]